MPFLRTAALAFGLVVVSAAPAHAKSAIANPYDCKPDPALTQPFAPFGDLGLYTPVPHPARPSGHSTASAVAASTKTIATESSVSSSRRSARRCARARARSM